MAPLQLPSLPRNIRSRRWLLVLLIFPILLLASLWWLKPAPPKRIRMATGKPNDVYANLGDRYHDELKNLGLDVQVVHTSGSVDNLKRLLNDQVDVALIQGGTYSPVSDPNGTVQAVATVGQEPLWMFYRSAGSHEKTKKINRISEFLDLKGPGGNVRIGLGVQGSGTEALAKTLLREHGITQRNADFKNLTLTATAKQLQAGNLEVGFFVTSYHHRSVIDLLQDPNIQLLAVQRRTAYARRFPYLHQVTLAEGVLDLQQDLPREDKELLAPPTLLVCRADLHPRTVEQVLRASTAIHKTPGLLTPAPHFPSTKGVDMPMHPAAMRYLDSGESFLTRLLPYWVLRHVFQLQILVLPLVIALLPYLKVVPVVYRFRINRLLRQHYRVLRELEENIEKSDDPAVLREGLKELDRLRSEMEGVSKKIPGHLQREIYHWRLHVIMVRNEVLARLRTLESEEMPNSSAMLGRSIHGPGLVDSYVPPSESPAKTSTSSAD